MSSTTCSHSAFNGRIPILSVGESKVIDYSDDVSQIGVEQLHGFFDGWPNPPSPQTHLRLLRNSSHAVIAIHRESDAVVGFVTALSDGELCAYIPLLEVLPAHRGNGIGSKLVERVLQLLDGLYMVDLLCDEHMQPFYEKIGMHRATGMMLRRYEHQRGRTLPR